ncbi:MAG: hypothetical protein CMP73_01270 [Flavobacteriales bacterium]|nr:hypothetical protein [Flavobacteriales bacterium]|tara:strand:+ start:90 stop:419 length:330 start_codon:yes stop_codon:yes gene_type:complete
MITLINVGIILTYIMIAFGALTAIYFGVKKMIQNQNNTKKTMYTIGGLILVLIVSYLFASDEVLGSYEKYSITPSTAKQVGMGLTAFYILALTAILSVLYTEFSKLRSK